MSLPSREARCKKHSRVQLKLKSDIGSCIPGHPVQDREDTAGCPDTQLAAAPALHSAQQQMVTFKGNKVMGEAQTVRGSTV